MEEKVLIKSYCPSTKKFFKIMLIIGLVLGLLFFMARCSDVASSVAEYKETYNEHQEAGKCGWGYSRYEKCWRCEYVEENSAFGTGLEAGVGVFAAVMVFALVIKLLLSSFSLVVTDKRVYCKTLWIHKVCLPVDSITAVARIGIINVLAIGAPAGRIYVSFVMNSKAIYEVLNNLFIARQEKSLAAIMGFEDEVAEEQKSEE